MPNRSAIAWKSARFAETTQRSFFICSPLSC
jgi:hypothetical protein